MRRVGNALTRCKGVGAFGSALLRREGVRGFGFGIGCSGVIQMTQGGRRQVRIGQIGVGTVTVVTLLCGQLHNCLQCADRFRGGLDTNSAGQIDRPQREVECRWAIVGRTGSVGEGMRVNTRLRAVSVDEGCKLCSICCFASSVSLLSTMSMFVTVVGGSISALTTMALLLLGKLWVSLLVLHSAKLVGLVTVACGRALRALFKGQSGRCNDLVGFEGLDIHRLGLVNELSYYLHRRRELCDQNHCLHGE